MKNLLLIALTLMLSTGAVLADKKCCKDKEGCKKEACAKAETKKACAGDATKACCKDKAKAEASVGTADAAAPLHACCQKSVAAGKMPCCAKKGEVKVNDDGTVAE